MIDHYGRMIDDPQAALRLMNGSSSLGEIAERMLAGFGERFGRAEDLRRRVLEVVRREQGRSR